MIFREDSGLTEEAISLLRRAVARAKEIPQGFDMNNWVVRSEEVPCGTAGCLAFEVCVASGIDPIQLQYYRYQEESQERIPQIASKLLGIYPSNHLFLADEWPERYCERFYAAPFQSFERALILEEVVEFWIANGGKFPYEEEDEE